MPKQNKSDLDQNQIEGKTTEVTNEEKNYFSSEKLIALKQALLGVKVNIDKAIQILSQGEEPTEEFPTSFDESIQRLRGFASEAGAGDRVIEGVFDGENMVGPDGKIYTIPANYASKSKLVEGDIMKLTIAPNGSFIYKQIGPVERDRLVGVLGQVEGSGDYVVYIKDKKWRVLKASVTYFKGEPGDETVVFVPKDRPSKWAAVENIIKKKE